MSYGFFTPLPFRPLACSPPGFFTPWLFHFLADSPPGLFATWSIPFSLWMIHPPLPPAEYTGDLLLRLVFNLQKGNKKCIVTPLINSYFN